MPNNVRSCEPLPDLGHVTLRHVLQTKSTPYLALAWWPAFLLAHGAGELGRVWKHALGCCCGYKYVDVKTAREIGRDDEQPRGWVQRSRFPPSEPDQAMFGLASFIHAAAQAQASPLMPYGVAAELIYGLPLREPPQFAGFFIKPTLLRIRGHPLQLCTCYNGRLLKLDCFEALDSLALGTTPARDRHSFTSWIAGKLAASHLRTLSSSKRRRDP